MEEKWEICKSPWCKAKFNYRDIDMITNEEGILVAPKFCQKCGSFNNELSGGVEWKDKEYEGSRFDGMSHQFNYKITNFK